MASSTADLIGGRIVRQPLPDPPAVYDQAYFFRLVNALSLFMNEVTAQAEHIAARYITTDCPVVDPTGNTPGSLTNTASLATGTIYLLVANPTVAYLTVVRGTDA